MRGSLRLLRQRYAKVIWTPGNHELWTLHQDPVQLRGEARYQALVQMCQDNDILTPEDEFAIWLGPTGPMTIVPLFQLYDHSWLAPGTRTKKESLEYAYRTGVVCTDEMLLHPDPYPDRESWCDARLKESERRLFALGPDVKTVLVSHWPLVRQPTDVLRFPSSRSGAAPPGPPIGTPGFGPRSPSMATCTSRARPTTTASASRRSRSATRASGASAASRQCRRRCSRDDRTAAARPRTRRGRCQHTGAIAEAIHFQNRVRNSPPSPGLHAGTDAHDTMSTVTSIE